MHIVILYSNTQLGTLSFYTKIMIGDIPRMNRSFEIHCHCFQGYLKQK